jgi:hypothetical protein
VEFVGRHLLDPVDSKNHDYIRSKVKEQLAGSSVTVVLIGGKTAESDWVTDEIRWSLDKSNGVLGIRLDTAGRTPQALVDCGAEVINWVPHDFADAIERAALAARRREVISSPSSGGGDSCGR